MTATSVSQPGLGDRVVEPAPQEDAVGQVGELVVKRAVVAEQRLLSPR